MNFIKTIISDTNNNELLQKIRDDAEKKYTRQFGKLLTGIDFLIDEKTDLTWSVVILNRVNDQLPSVIKKLNDLFARCKKECKKHAPSHTIEQFDDLETNNKYSYAQTCKSFKIIEACIKFNYLFSLFETRLNRLYRKTKSSKTRASRSASRSSSSSKSKSKTRRESPKSPTINSLDKFIETYREFVLFTKRQ